MFRVVATRQGLYNQQLREAGEVFDLLRKRDGSYRHMTRRQPVLTPEGVPVPGQFKKIQVQAKDGYGRPMKGEKDKFVAEHEDYAEDMGNVLMTEGPNAGENIHLGWMYKVPDSTPIGQYPEDTDFWSNLMLPPPLKREVAPGGTASRAACPIRDYDDQEVRVVAPGTKDGKTNLPKPPGMAGG